MTPFDILVVRSGRAAVVQVCGELDLSTAPVDRQITLDLSPGTVE